MGMEKEPILERLQKHCGETFAPELGIYGEGKASERIARSIMDFKENR